MSQLEKHFLDLIGLNCPLPVMKTRKKLAQLGEGAVLTVVATDPMSAIDIPHMCNEDGHQLVSSQLLDEKKREFTICRGPVLA
ncbi:sulfurtransferase TusA family protein [Rhodobacteraceae bacterium RKSG542]|uniref:sulfurtransferase TusA family protein n=1 Tax=Pseudovibrio flavus TaxID=2529854 RepID=UPI0012BB5680|nr:sulfurtransferase TusA family protein [Pseudovibrio flavus]MTI18389.1 sulfurtransferase TusA family protein [Pseudovibrio flavus]